MRRLLVLLVVPALLGLGAGCGGGDSSSSTTSAPTDAETTQAVGQPATDLEQRFVDVIRKVAPSVVQIQHEGGLGSGVTYDDRGHIVTNNHVVGTGRSFTVTLAGGDRHKATLVGTFPAEDLAVIRLADGSPPVATWADSSKVRVGQFALAMGNPLGYRSSVTQGIVSSLGRTVGEGGGSVITSAIQTSASINPGNSGGALVDLQGQVIGVPTLAAVNPQQGSQAPGIGFAIPSNTVKRIAPQLIDDGEVTRSGRAYLGIDAGTRFEPPGVVVGRVRPGGPAARAGIREGDIIVSVDGKPIGSTEELVTVLAGLDPGDTVPVEISRDGAERTVQVRLGDLGDLPG